MKKGRRILSLLCGVLLVGASVLGTAAYLTDRTEKLTNTFTVGTIDISLAENTSSFKMIPGNDIDKDPIITVESGSEASYLFVKVEESDNFANFMTWQIAAGWTELTGQTGVYYRLTDATNTDLSFHVLANDSVHVLESVTKGELDALTSGTLPKLSFTAYAVQRDNIATPEAAWTIVNS